MSRSKKTVVKTTSSVEAMVAFSEPRASTNRPTANVNTIHNAEGRDAPALLCKDRGKIGSW